MNIDKVLSEILRSGAGSGFAGGLAGGLATGLLTSKAGRKLGKKALEVGGRGAEACRWVEPPARRASAEAVA